MASAGFKTASRGPGFRPRNPGNKIRNPKPVVLRHGLKSHRMPHPPRHGARSASDRTDRQKIEWPNIRLAGPSRASRTTETVAQLVGGGNHAGRAAGRNAVNGIRHRASRLFAGRKRECRTSHLLFSQCRLPRDISNPNQLERRAIRTTLEGRSGLDRRPESHSNQSQPPIKRHGRSAPRRHRYANYR